MDEQMLNIVLGLLLILAALAVAAWGLCYVMKSAAIYTMAKRRGIARPYLAWFPILRQALLGALTDQYLYVTRGRCRRYRWLLPIMDLLWRLLGYFLITLAVKLLSMQAPLDQFLGMLGLFVPLPVIHILGQLLAKYWLLRSSAGKDGPLAFLLAAFVPMAEPALLLWYCRADRGMPPRRTEETRP